MARFGPLALPRIADTPLRAHWLGCALCVTIALASQTVAAACGGPALLYAVLLGACLHTVAVAPDCAPGVQFCSRSLLRFAVVLLGTRVSLADAAAIPAAAYLWLALSVIATIAFAAWLGRRCGMEWQTGLVAGAAVGICGAAAAMTVSAVFDARRERPIPVGIIAALVTLLATLSALIYPLLARLMAWSELQASWLIGGTIHDMGQVFAAGAAISAHTATLAMTVKTLRIAMLVPVALTAANLGAAPGARRLRLPWFLVAYVLVAAAANSGAMPPALRSALDQLSQTGLLVAMAALGTTLSAGVLRTSGPRLVITILAATALLIVLVSSGSRLLHG